ncbi:MAG: hypothetical protein A3G95_00855 [Flavobacteria bacterium RIFCSPLOWO2_12_FULL_31_7]|nr:MAG: hypothetical protein A3G95_00855 [Flavobacteria bacterium RIFCSPLOWO2_12_FULL_31_7]
MSTIFSTVSLKYSALIISVISIFSISGGGDDESYWTNYNSSFAPEAFVDDESYEPLFYSTDMFYGYDNYMQGHSYRFVDTQVKEWNTYLENQISKETLNVIIGTDSLNDVVAKVCSAIKTNKPNGASRKYNLENVKTKHFFEFINLAKSLEEATNFYPDWDYKTDTYSESTKIKTSVVKKIEKLYNETTDNFLKEKYWFLTIKASFYSENRSNAISFFNGTSAKVEKGISYYRALSYLAGINYAQKKYALSNYQFAVVFENCPILRKEAIFDFKPQETKDFNESLNMAKSIEEKAALWTLYGYYADPVEAIAKVYELDPKNKHLTYLLTRAVNIEENNLNHTEYVKYTLKSYVNESKLDKKLYALVTEIAQTNNTMNPYMWDIVAGYFETLKGNYSKATTHLNEAKKTAPQKALVQNQIKLFAIFNQVSKTKVLNPQTENELLPNLVWLYNYNKQIQNSTEYYSKETSDEEMKLRTDFLVSWSRSYISNLYKKQNNEVMSELFSREDNYYAKKERLEKMQTYFLENKNTAWDKLAQSLYTITLDDIYEYNGIMFAYNNQIDEAIDEFKKCKKLDTLYGNPFNGKIMDCIDCDHNAKQKTKYTKLTFMQKVKEIQDHVANDVETYSGNILLGNAFYNMSHYGNARLFYNNPIVDQYGNYIDEEYSDMLYNNSQTEYYYKKALSVAQNDEEKAKATFLLTKIERNKFYLSKQYVPDEVDFITFKGYKTLMQNYSNTKYYQEVINECGYFSRVADQ